MMLSFGHVREAPGYGCKLAEVKTPLLPHQQRVVERMKQEDQPGLVVAHGLGSGKCVRGDTLILTDLGAVRIDSLFASDDLPLSGDVTLPPSSHRVLSIINGFPKWQSIRARFCQRLNGFSTTVVTATSGVRVDCTDAHPFLVLRGGVPTWVPAVYLLPGDFLVVPCATAAPEHTKRVAPELVDLVTWQITEGWEGAKATTTITQQDEEVLCHLLSCFRKLFPESTAGHIRRPKGGRAPYLEISSKEYKELLESGGYTWGRKSAQKTLPNWFFSLPNSQLRRGLQNLFDAEASVGVGGVEFTSASAELIGQIQYSLLRFGIRSTIKSKIGMATNGHRIKRTYYRLAIYGPQACVFHREVGFSYEHKQAALSELVAKKRNPNNGIPISWLYELLAPLGLGAKSLGISENSRRSLSIASCRKAVERLEWLATREAKDLYTRRSKSCGGTAKKFIDRTLAAIATGGKLLLKAAARLTALVDADFSYCEVIDISRGDVGGYVYDVEVDSDDYDAKNYVGGTGGVILHNTLTSIATQDALGMPATVVMPAALQENYRKERAKHLTGNTQPIDPVTLQAVARRGAAPHNPMLIVDEAHRAREPGTAGLSALKGTPAEKRMLLTATPFYNSPSDIAPLVNLVANQKMLPEQKQEFLARYVSEVPVKPSLWGRIMRNETPGVTYDVNPKRRPELQRVFDKYVDYHPSSAAGFPSVAREDVKVPMTGKQLDFYDTMLKSAPPWVAAKIRSGLPPSKQESKELNAFMGAVRQISNSTAPFKPGDVPEQPKIEAAFKRVKDTLDANERAKAVIYSNYLESGVNPYAEMLTRANIPFGKFTGEMKQQERDQLVKDYNDNKLRVLMLSSAGGEGLDLKGTRLLQVLEPHWNMEKIKQVEGRGVRYGSHAGLSPEEQNVRIERYLATRSPKGLMERMGLKKPGGSVDEYLAGLSDSKEQLNAKFRDILVSQERRRAEQSKTAGVGWDIHGYHGEHGKSYDDIVNSRVPTPFDAQTNYSMSR